MNDFSLGFTGLLGYTEKLNEEASPVFAWTSFFYQSTQSTLERSRPRRT